MPARQDIPGLVEHLFRHESSRLIASLTRLLGVHNLEAAEEIVQETLLAALRVWPYHPPIENPAAWLTRAARNRAIDLIRRERHRRRFADEYEAGLRSDRTLDAAVARSIRDEGIEDDQLRMIFTCCHPALPPESQIALTLRLLCGLTAAELGSALLTSEATIQKRLYRGRRRLREPDISFEVPGGDALLGRLDAVQTVLYLLFNEGYQASRAAGPIRRDLCREALRLALLVARDDRLRGPGADALVALMCFHSARLPARLDDEGSVHLLGDQDRRLWDRDLIDRGFEHLGRASTGDEVTRYHLEAAIAACHCSAPRFEETDWVRILELYDMLLDRHPSPVVRLNRAIALGHARGPAAAIGALQPLLSDPALAAYHLLPAALGEFHLRAGDVAGAAGFFDRALRLASSEADRAILRRKAAACRDDAPLTTGSPGEIREDSQSTRRTP